MHPRLRGGDGGVHASREHGRAFYSDLVLCGSVWACPVCAAKIQERRREKSPAIDWAYAEGLQPTMVTLTFPHYVWRVLRELRDQQADALHRLRATVSPGAGSRRPTGLPNPGPGTDLRRKRVAFTCPELWFVDACVDADAMREKVLDRWRSSCAQGTACWVLPMPPRCARPTLRGGRGGLV